MASFLISVTKHSSRCQDAAFHWGMCFLSVVGVQFRGIILHPFSLELNLLYIILVRRFDFKNKIGVYWVKGLHVGLHVKRSCRLAN